jgi:hypothetical protein
LPEGEITSTTCSHAAFDPGASRTAWPMEQRAAANHRRGPTASCSADLSGALRALSRLGGDAGCAAPVSEAAEVYVRSTCSRLAR